MSKCSVDKINSGDFYSRLSYGTIRSAYGGSCEIKNEEGEQWTISANIVQNEFYIHNQFTEEKTVTKTELAEIFLQNSNIIMSVNFNKQVKTEDVVNKLVSELYANKGGKIISESEFKKKAKVIATEVVTGENRTMIGRHFGELTDLGRVQFVDMQVELDKTKSYDNRLRQVDPRTIQWIIVKNIKYILK